MTTTEQTPKHQDSKRSKPGKGCLLLASLVLIGSSVVLYGFWQIWATVSNYEDRYLNAGYVLQEGTNLNITEPVLVNTYFYARETLILESGADASLAITAHEAFIKGRVTGNIAFLGGDLEISEGAFVEGTIDVSMARNVVIRGVVGGEITGTWTRLYELHQEQGTEEPIPANDAVSPSE